jgi:hypothetical protein
MSATSGMSKYMLEMQKCIYFNKQKLPKLQFKLYMTWGSKLHSCMQKLFPVSFGMQPKKVMTD